MGKRFGVPVLVLAVALLLQWWYAQPAGQSVSATQAQTQTQTLRADGVYTGCDEVALYLETYGELPDNYITKKEAERLGWDDSARSLHAVAPGKSIGGDYFGDYEDKLPDAPGRDWHECDIDSEDGRRGVERIVFSTDGLIYYTDDHYESFTQLYE